MKSLQKRNYIRSKKILASAKGEQCTIQYGWCCDPETVRFIHSNESEDGKGRGIKAEDIYGAYACHVCDQWLDSPSENGQQADLKYYYFHRGMKRTWKRLIEKGLIKIV